MEHAYPSPHPARPAGADVIANVRRALGRSGPSAVPPVPPAINEPVTRLVHADLGLPELFARSAREARMGADQVYVEDLPARLVAFLRGQNCRRLALPLSPLLEKLQVPKALREAGFEVATWDQMAPDALYDTDASVTDVYCAVAETGSLVIRNSPAHGKALSLVPDVHVAILQPKDFVPDLVDLFDKLTREGVGSNVTLITGPSRTADIEMTLVTGVHGPRVVQLYVLQ